MQRLNDQNASFAVLCKYQSRIIQIPGMALTASPTLYRGPSQKRVITLIRTVADFLGELAQAEAKKLAASDIKHPTVIGGMYEGLAREILCRSVPDGLDLRVVSGFAVDGTGGSSGQIDCMLVRGQGTPVPYTPGTYQWHVKDVIAVFEVKKSLFGDDLSDAFVHLRGVLETYTAWIQNPLQPATLDLQPTLRAFAQTTGEVAPPTGQWRTMPPNRHLILHTMIGDQIAPLRIIFGYGGYSTELGLRTGFLKYLAANQNRIGFGPPSLPNLIVAGGSSLIKLNGHPYHAQLLPNGRWPLVASAHLNPVLFILELIWTRISYGHHVAQIFGEDLETEGLFPLIDAIPTQRPDDPPSWGWAFYSHKSTRAQLAKAPAREPWRPTELDLIQFVVVQRLCKEDIDIHDPDFIHFLAAEGRQVDEFVSSLVATTLVARKGLKLQLTTIQCDCVILPDGRRIAAENNTGRLSRWLIRYAEERTQGPIAPDA